MERRAWRVQTDTDGTQGKVQANGGRYRQRIGVRITCDGIVCAEISNLSWFGQLMSVCLMLMGTKLKLLQKIIKIYLQFVQGQGNPPRVSQICSPQWGLLSFGSWIYLTQRWISLSLYKGVVSPTTFQLPKENWISFQKLLRNFIWIENGAQIWLTLMSQFTICSPKWSFFPRMSKDVYGKTALWILQEILGKLWGGRNNGYCI